MSETIDDRISEDLGLDVVTLEHTTRLRLDLLRMERGQASELGYVVIERENHPDAAVVFPSVEDATVALDDHPLIEDLCAEDSLHAYVPDAPTHGLLASCEFFLPN